MKNDETNPENAPGEMHKRRETMPDGKRYMIFYTFGNENPITANGEVFAPVSVENEVKENV